MHDSLYVYNNYVNFIILKLIFSSTLTKVCSVGGPKHV